MSLDKIEARELARRPANPHKAALAIADLARAQIGGPFTTDSDARTALELAARIGDLLADLAIRLETRAERRTRLAR